MKLLFLLEDVDESKRPAGQLEDLCVDFLKDTFASDESSSRSFSIAPHSNVNDSHNEDITVRNGGKEYRIDVKMLKANGGSRKIGLIMKGTHLPIPTLTAASRTAGSIGRSLGRQITRGVLGTGHSTVANAAGTLVGSLLGDLFR